MSQLFFSHWCFLCASENEANVEIKSLDEATREIIGEFSIIVRIKFLSRLRRSNLLHFQNFALRGVPDCICRSCQEFLQGYERRKILYANAEKMFMELLKMKNKPIDIETFRRKHGISCNETQEHPEPPQYARLIEEVNREIVPNDQVEEDLKETSEEANEEQPVEIPSTVSIVLRKKTPKQTSHSHLKVPIRAARATRRTIKIEAVSSLPKLLNPTIHPKISSVPRLELFFCDLCTHNCSTKTAMERHMKQIHLKNSTSFQCATCFKSFAKKIILQNHEKIHMTHRPTFDCKVCGKVLSSQTSVSNHMQWFHKEKREFKCTSCSKMFATVSLNKLLSIDNLVSRMLLINRKVR